MNGPVSFPLPLQQMMDSLYPRPVTREVLPGSVCYSWDSVMLKRRLWLNKSAFMEQSTVKQS